MVIQRWQSLLLLIATLMMAIFCVFSFGQVQESDLTLDLYSYGIYQYPKEVLRQGTLYVTIVAALTGLLTLICIFKYRNTRAQKRVCLLSMLLILAVYCSQYVVLSNLTVTFSNVQLNVVACAPAVAFFAIVAAYRCIRSDERKLAAADRLR